MSRKHQIRVVAFGDSITEATHQAPEARWPAILNQTIQPHFSDCVITIINAGVGGNTTREGLQRIEKDVTSHEPHLVLAEFGNDIVQPVLSEEIRLILSTHKEQHPCKNLPTA